MVERDGLKLAIGQRFSDALQFGAFDVALPAVRECRQQAEGENGFLFVSIHDEFRR